MLEEFLRHIPPNIAMYIRERQEKNGQKAAILADEYNLIHKTKKFSSPEQSSPSVSCAFCKQKGHLIKDCPSPKCQVAKSARASPSQNNKPESSKNSAQLKKTLHCSQHMDDFSDFISAGKVNDTPVRLLRDTGSSQTLITSKLKHLTVPTNKFVTVTDLTSKTVLPIVKISLDCPYFVGLVKM